MAASVTPVVGSPRGTTRTGAADRCAESADLLPLRGHRVDVQALRGVAVLLVVLYHARVLAPGGFVGVDVFFVISGFVIGRQLVAELVDTGSVSFRAFSSRRVHRLLPALAVMLVVVLLAAPLLAPIGAGEVTSRTGAAAAVFGANLFLQVSTSASYFAADAEWNPLLHTWSLSVEEQFYLLVPVLLWLLWRAGSAATRSLRRLRTGVVVLLVGSLSLCVLTTYAGGGDASRFAFFSPFTRAWEFAAGLALVVLPRRWLAGRSGRTASVAVGLAFIAAAAIGFSDATTFPGVAAAVPVVGTVLVLYGGTAGTTGTAGAGADRGTAARWAVGPLARLGDVSYGWYLWHWPLIVFAAAFWPTAGSVPLVLAAALSLGLAWASTRWIDGAGRLGRRRDGVATVRLAAVCIAAPIVAAMLAVPLTRLADGRVDHLRPPSEHAGMRQGCNGVTPLPARDPATCRWGDEGGGASVVLVGDSNADHLSETLIGAAGAADASLWIATMAGCPMSDVVVDAAWSDDGGRACRRFVDGAVAELVERPPDTVVIANATDKYLFSDEVVLIDPRTGDSADTSDERQQLLADGLERTSSRLSAAGIRVVVVEVVPKPMWQDVDFDTDDCSNLLLLVDPGRCATPSFDVADHTTEAQQSERRAAGATGAETWDLGGALCPGGRCNSTPGQPSRWIDPDHISVAAAESLAPVAARLLGDPRSP